MNNNDIKYFYLKESPDHLDLKDLFQGKYIKNRKEWRFNKNQQEQVTKFLYCSSSESENDCLDNKFTRSDDDSDQDVKTTETTKIKKLRKDRLHRANSFNASDTSDEEHGSSDEKYRRKRQNKQKISRDVNVIKKELSKLEMEEKKIT
jgi:hypothetical protein